MITVVEWYEYFEVIFCFLTSRKSYFFRVNKTTIQVWAAFCYGQDTGNEFRVTGNDLKHHFLDLTDVVFCDVQET